jgi:hypothetical protein
MSINLIIKETQDWGCISVAECLSCMCEALGFIPITEEREKEGERKGRTEQGGRRREGRRERIMR